MSVQLTDNKCKLHVNCSVKIYSDDSDIQCQLRKLKLQIIKVS